MKGKCKHKDRFGYCLLTNELCWWDKQKWDTCEDYIEDED